MRDVLLYLPGVKRKPEIEAAIRRSALGLGCRFISHAYGFQRGRKATVNSSINEVRELASELAAAGSLIRYVVAKSFSGFVCEHLDIGLRRVFLGPLLQDRKNPDSSMLDRPISEIRAKELYLAVGTRSRIPTKILVGSEDKFRQGLPDHYDMQVIDGAGHTFMLDDGLLASIDLFLRHDDSSDDVS
jgi:pimeloyl-ACP methyl ester carboxylesterase